MHRSSHLSLLLTFVLSTPLVFSQAQMAPSTSGQDRRSAVVHDLDEVYTFAVPRSKQEWIERAARLRRQILASAGLWPMPPKTALNPRIFDRLERHGYTIEKVYFESHPGFFVTGNLYRPASTGEATVKRHPTVLSTHGHWQYGRLENSELSSVPGRAINLARQGYVVFSYDMIGFNDSFQLTHQFGGTREELWGISLSGLQLWNSIRALDFVLSLPDVDPDRIAVTGASGGGTQTILLTAVDDRVKVSAPVNMVSAHMQGGCLCENAPGLRIDTNNVEIAALMAPRPMLLVSATKDWTKDTLTVEYPAIRNVYRLFDAEDKVQAVQMDVEHNYNRDSREAVYAWFGRWLLGIEGANKLKEQAFEVEMPSRLLVFYNLEKPARAVGPDTLISYLIGTAQEQLDTLKPKDRDGLNLFRQRMGPALQLALAVDSPNFEDLEVSERTKESRGTYDIEHFFIGRKGKGDRIPVTLWSPWRAIVGKVPTLVVHEDGRSALQSSSEPGNLVSELLSKGQKVMAIDCFQTGQVKSVRPNRPRFYTTYNRTDDSERVQDIMTAISYLKGKGRDIPINLVGIGKAGLWSLLARGLSSGIRHSVIDAARFDNTKDQSYLQSLSAPGLRRAGDLFTAAVLAAPSQLTIHNTGNVFQAGWIADVYKALGAENEFQQSSQELTIWQVAKRLQR